VVIVTPQQGQDPKQDRHFRASTAVSTPARPPATATAGLDALSRATHSLGGLLAVRRQLGVIRVVGHLDGLSLRGRKVLLGLDDAGDHLSAVRHGKLDCRGRLPG
jgi:hypothetical protein